MIGPSSGTADEVPESQTSSARKRAFDELDIENLCEEIRQSGRKRYLEELETPTELVDSSEPTALFSPLTGETVVDDGPVARLEVLLVDGTSCTWTTVSDFEHQQNLVASSSSFASPAEYVLREDERRAEETDCSNYWTPVGSVVALSQTSSRNGRVADVSSQREQQQQQQQQQQQYDDQETGNLSWLLDFKLDPFIEAADDRSTMGLSANENHYGNKAKINGRAYASATCPGDAKRGFNNNNGQEVASSLHHHSSRTSYATTEPRGFASPRCVGPKKPPFTYTELIEHALQERGELTVSAIYQWISERFPYYKSNDDRWKNSVRHNLSINPHFRKGSKAPHGAGHLWAIASRGETRPRQIVASTVRQFLKGAADTEAEAEATRRNGKGFRETTPLDEVEAATASIAAPRSEGEADGIVDSVSLEHCAEQILSGIKKEVEVQYIVPMMLANDDQDPSQSSMQTHAELHYPVKESDFLNPVSKEVVAEECGLISEGYLVTDLNPANLGLNVLESEIISPENLFGEELSFQFYELTSPSQVQSA